MNNKYKILTLSLFSLLASCSNEITEVLPDGSDEIRMSVKKGISTRAADDVYRDWSADKDPSTMGVIAFTNESLSDYIYNNVSFAAPESGDAWTCANKKYWRDYYSATKLDFFAYMPHVDGATVENDGNGYTLTIPNVPGVSAEPYLVATTPVRYTSAYSHVTPVAMKMDQVMSRFDFRFKLGDEMSGLRTFRITKVKMSEIPASATVSQSYSVKDDAWTKGTMEVSAESASTTSSEVEMEEGIIVGYMGDKDKDYVSFPKSIYMLPFDLKEVTPKIEVTYDVYDEDGYKTRSATSTILLNKSNFGELGTVEPANRNTINILIVPEKLKVLSDADQTFAGFLPIEQ